MSRERRLAQVLLCAAFPVLSTIFFSSMFYFTQQPTRDYPEWARLDQLLLQAEVLRTRQSETNGGGDLVNELEVYIAGHYRMVIEDPGFWPPRMSERRRERFRAAQKLVDRHPAVTVPELQAAESRIEPLLISVDNALEVRANLPLFAAFLFATLAGLGGLVSTALFRGGLLMGSFGVAVVVRSGRPAPFWRVLLRGVLVWGTVLLLFPGGWARLLTLNVFGSIEALQGLSVAVTSYGFLGMAPSAFLIASAAAWAVLHPSRGLQDRLAGTYLVPR